MNPPKILFFTSLFPNTDTPVLGKFNYLRAKALIKKGCTVKVLCPVGLTPPLNYFFPQLQLKRIFEEITKKRRISNQAYYDNIDVLYPKWWWLPRNFFWKYEAYLLHLFIGKIFEEFITSFKPDMIIASWLNPFGVYSKYLKKFKLPYILITEGSDIIIYPKKYPGIKSIKKIIESSVDGLIYVSKHSMQNGNRYISVPKTKVIYNGYNESLFYHAIKLNGVPKERYNLITTGAHLPVKGYDILLQVMKILDDNYHLSMIGTGPLTETFKEFISEHKLHSKISLLGELDQNQIRDNLNKADLYIQPSRSEGFPSAPLEAMACGLPVVATKVGGLPELIIPKFNGLLCEANSVESILECIKEAEKIEWDRNKISQWVKDSYGWNIWAENFLEFYENNFKSGKGTLTVLDQNRPTILQV